MPVSLLPIRRRARFAIAAVTVLLSLVATSAASAAPDSMLDFEDLSPGTALGEYHGVEFGSKADLGFVEQPGAHDGSFTPPGRGFETCDRVMLVVSPGLRGDRRLQPQCNNAPKSSRAFDPSNGGETFAAFSVTRRRVSLRLRGHPCVDDAVVVGQHTARCGMRVALIAYALDGRRLDYDVADAGDETLSVSSPHNDIAFIEGANDFGEHPGSDVLGVDDLSFDNPEAVEPPDFFLIGAESGVLAGGTADVALRLRRINLSSGPVVLSHGPLPGGVESVTFAPNPSSIGSVTAKVKLSPDAPAGASLAIPVVAAPLSRDAGPQTRTATLIIEAAAPYGLAGTYPVKVDPCSSATRRLTAGVDDRYVGLPVTVTLRADAPFTVTPTEFVAAPAGQTSRDIQISVPAGATAYRDRSIAIELSAPGYATQKQSMPIEVRRPGIYDVRFPGSSTNGFLREPAGRVVVDGHGLCPGSTIALGGPVRVTARPARDEAIGTRLSAEVPVVASPGVVTVTTPDGDATAVSSKLRTYRSLWGFAFTNFGGDLISEDDIVSGFTDSRSSSSNICKTLTFGLLSCKVGGAIEPWAKAFIGSRIDGLCYGFSAASAKVALGQSVSGIAAGSQLFGLGPPAGPPAWLHDAIRHQHIMQFSKAAQGARSPAGGSDIGPRVSDMLLAGDAPLMLISVIDNGQWFGHALVAYRVRPRIGGGSSIDVYDPNVPFSPGEDAGSTLARGTISTSPNGSWSFPGLTFGGPMLAGMPWAGDGGSIETVSPRRIPAWGHGTLVTNVAVMDRAATVTDDRGRPASEVRGTKPLPTLDSHGGPMLYRLTPDRAWRISGGAGFNGDGWSASADPTGTGAAARSAQTVVDPRARSIGSRGNGARLTVSVDHGAGSRTATAQGPRGTSLGFTSSEDGLVLTGRGEVTVTFGSTGRRDAPTAARVRVPLGRGRTTVSPADWTRTGDVRVHVRNGGTKRVLVARRVRLGVRLGAPKVALAGRTATVRVRASSVRAADGKIAVTAVAIRGGKPAGRPAARVVGRKGALVSLRIRRLPKGRLTIRVVATAIGTVGGDQVSGSAQRRAKITVR